MRTDETNFEYLALDLGRIRKGVVSYISSSLHYVSLIYRVSQEHWTTVGHCQQ